MTQQTKSSVPSQRTDPPRIVTLRPVYQCSLSGVGESCGDCQRGTDAEKQQDGARMEGAGAQDSTEALGTDIPAPSRPLALSPAAHPLTMCTPLAGPSVGPSCISAPASDCFPKTQVCVSPKPAPSMVFLGIILT